MTFFLKLYIAATLLISIFLSHSSALGQTKYEFTPGIAAGLTYDDNINLSSTNPISDYITTVSPSILVNILSEKNNFTTESQSAQSVYFFDPIGRYQSNQTTLALGP